MPLKQLPPAAPGSVRDRKRELLRKYSGAFLYTTDINIMAIPASTYRVLAWIQRGRLWEYVYFDIISPIPPISSNAIIVL